MDPRLKYIMESTIIERDVAQMASNLRGIDVLIRMGSKDTSVPPYFMRRMARVLQEVGTNVTISEIEGMGHWY